MHAAFGRRSKIEKSPHAVSTRADPPPPSATLHRAASLEKMSAAAAARIEPAASHACTYLPRAECQPEVTLLLFPRRAARSFVENGLTVVVGGPGTGKTYTIAHALAAALEPDHDGRIPRIAVCAPTGKAAARAGDSLAEAAEVLGGDVADRLLAVSYTHLPLPTLCSV